MTWSISASGSKQDAIAKLKEAPQLGINEQDAAQYERARAHVLAELEAAAPGCQVSVSCSGHASDTGAAETFSISTWTPDPPSQPA